MLSLVFVIFHCCLSHFFVNVGQHSQILLDDCFSLWRIDGNLHFLYNIQMNVIRCRSGYNGTYQSPVNIRVMNQQLSLL